MKRTKQFPLAVIGLLICNLSASALTIYTSEADFLGASQVVSTETFDQFSSGTYLSPSMTIGGVVYQTPASSWAFIGAPYADVHSLPSALIARDILNPATLSFGGGRYVNAFGFYFGGFTTAAWPVYQIDITETDGTHSVVPITGQSVLAVIGFGGSAGYFGFVSEVGIASLQVGLILPPDQYGGVNWFYDDVSRSAILGGEVLPDNYTVLTYPQEPQGERVPDSGATAALMGVGLLGLGFLRQRVA